MASIQLGAQSYSFRNFDIQGALNCLKQLGLEYMEFCFAHFDSNPAHQDLQRGLDLIRNARVLTPTFGVVSFTSDTMENLQKFQFAKVFGAEILTADPAPDSFDNLDALTEQFGIRVAIHNHGPESRYSKVADTLSAIKSHSPMIGACVDTGHALRSHEKPHEVIEQLGDRVICLHLKDWVMDGDEQIFGRGDADMPAVAKAVRGLNFSGPAVLEYENNPADPVPDMKIGLQNWRDAWGNK